MLWHQSLELLTAEIIADLSHFPDETGIYRLIRIDFHNDDYMIAGVEDFEGEPGGFTYTLYDSEGQDFSTNGNPDITKFSDEVRRIATWIGDD